MATQKKYSGCSKFKYDDRATVLGVMLYMYSIQETLQIIF